MSDVVIFALGALLGAVLAGGAAILGATLAERSNARRMDRLRKGFEAEARAMVRAGATTTDLLAWATRKP